MNCWDILGINPTDDTTSIRRNYARLVKENRPDENPEAFAAINRAYKDALVHAQHLATQSDEQAETQPVAASENPSGHIHHEIDGAAEHEIHIDDAGQKELISGIPVNVEQAPLEDLNTAWQRLTEKTSQLLKSSDESKEVSNWQFLEESDALYDIHFKSHFSRFLFQELISASPEEAFNHPLKGAVIDYLDSRFGWRLHRDDLEYDFDFSDIDFILGRRLSHVEQQVKNSSWYSKENGLPEREKTTLGERLVAALIDFVLMLGVAYLIPALPDTIESIAIYFSPDYASAIKRNGGPIHFATAALIMYFIMSTFMESSAMQATPGKWLLKMKAVDSFGNRLTLKHATYRSVMCILVSGLLIILFIIYTSHGERGTFSHMMQTMVTIFPVANIAWPYPGFGHDAFSKTLVLKR